METPVYETGVICTKCLGNDTVALVLDETKLVWCSCGLVLLYDGSPRTTTVLHDFKEE